MHCCCSYRGWHRCYPPMWRKATQHASAALWPRPTAPTSPAAAGRRPDAAQRAGQAGPPLPNWSAARTGGVPAQLRCPGSMRHGPTRAPRHGGTLQRHGARHSAGAELAVVGIGGAWVRRGRCRGAGAGRRASGQQARQVAAPTPPWQEPLRTGWHFGSPSSYYWAGLWQSPGGPLPPTCRACERQGRATAGVGVGSLPQQHLSHCGVTLPARGGPRMEGSWLVQKCKSSKRLYRSCAQGAGHQVPAVHLPPGQGCHRCSRGGKP